MVETKVALECAENDDWERSGVFQCVSEMLTSPAVSPYSAISAIRCSHAEVLDEALAEPDQRRDCDYDGYEVLAATSPIWPFCSRPVVAEEHT